MLSERSMLDVSESMRHDVAVLGQVFPRKTIFLPGFAKTLCTLPADIAIKIVNIINDDTIRRKL